MSRRDAHHKPGSWWGPVWRGLVVDRTAKHYRAMGSAVWLFLYLVIHADRRTGYLTRRYQTMAEHMGLNPRTIRRWLLTLRTSGYVLIRNSGRALEIWIRRWKPLARAARVATSGHSE